MSDNMKYSYALDTLVQYAKQIGDRKNAPLTAERYVAAVIDALDGTVAVPEEAAFSAEIEAILGKNMPWQQIREAMLSYVQESKNNTLLDDLYMKKRLAEAGEMAKEEGLDCLTPGILLKCILRTPSKVIRQCMGDFLETDEQDETRPAPKQGEEMPAVVPEEKSASEESAPAQESGVTEAAPENTREKIAQLTNRVKDIQQTLLQTVLGQEKAVSVFTSGYFQAELLSMTDKKRERPAATFLFAGPPGVGKTYLAESAAKALNLPFIRFDMSEYNTIDAVYQFHGGNKIIANSSSGVFTSFVQKNPKSVVLFDEIEKAHLNIIHLFLQILDAGRIRDNNTQKDISLKNVIMIFTTNAGKQLYENAAAGDFTNVSRKVILKALQEDVHPTTGVPFFPAAICSRFASGNVVMFNAMSAHNLRDIARREVLRHVQNFEKEIGIHVEIDEKVFTALLFAEGAGADARTIRSRAEAFFDNELFELFRLLGTESEGPRITDLEKIMIDVDLDSAVPEIRGYFDSPEPMDVLVFTGEEDAAKLSREPVNCRLFCTSDREEAEERMRGSDVRMVLIDIDCGRKDPEKQFLNREDVASDARDFLRRCHELYADIPVYLLETETCTFGDEERISYLRQGVRGMLKLDPAGNIFAAELDTILQQINQQQIMRALARANKLVSYETAQQIVSGGTCARIRLFDMTLETAMDAEDAGTVLSNISKPNVRFDQVIGAEDAKKELQYFVEYLKNPRKFRGTGVSAPKGVLLYGPPGTGKTMLAKAMASESDVTFISAEGNQFLKKYVGEGPEKVHELFRTARKYAPSILFVDEIDAIAKERRGGDSKGTEETLTAFLTEMDGFKNDLTKPVFVLAATNFDVEPGRAKSLDPALMRRFDRRVYIDLPNRDERIRYMRMKLSGNPAYAVSDEKISNIAIRSTGMSLAELESVLELSLRTAIRDGNMKVTDAILDEAFEIFHGGEKKNWGVAQLERVARHEAGHALMCYLGGETPSYVTIVARGDHGGYMQHGDQEDKNIYTRKELLDRIRVSLGGRGAEIVCYGPEDGITTGAAGDLVSATSIARQIICAYGMDEEFGLAVVDPQAANMGQASSDVRNAVNRILNTEMEVVIEIIRKNRLCIDRLVETLLAKNNVSGKEIEDIFRAAGI